MAFQWSTFLSSIRTRTIIHLASPKRASVAIIFHASSPQEALYLLYAQRTLNVTDRWSGQIAFPGGRANSLSEKNLMTAIRETREEIGIQLTPHDCIGQLDDRIVTENGLVVSSFVFFLNGKRPVIKKQLSEIKDAFWIPWKNLCPPNAVLTTLAFSKMELMGKKPNGISKHSFLWHLCRLAPLQTLHMPCIHLQTSKEVEKHHRLERVLWGLTLGITRDLLQLGGGKDFIPSTEMKQHEMNKTKILLWMYSHPWTTTTALSATTITAMTYLSSAM